jgi:hypothetical protein
MFIPNERNDTAWNEIDNQRVNSKVEKVSSTDENHRFFNSSRHSSRRSRQGQELAREHLLVLSLEQ